MKMSRGRRILVGVVIGGSAALGVAVSEPAAQAAGPDHGIDQAYNGDGTCTTAVAGWVSQTGTCDARMPQPVRQTAGTTVVAGATGGLVGGAEAAYAAMFTTVVSQLPW